MHAAEQHEIPDIITDPSTLKKYERGKCLYASKVYELKDMANGDVVAVKIVAKTLLQKLHQCDKMAQEIALHQTLANQHIVKLHSSFEDQHFVYIILELCCRRTLWELYRSRLTLTEPEIRYFFK